MTKFAILAAAALALGGCVVAEPLAVAPGQGKTYAQFQADDTTCRAAPAGTTATATGYYQCMAAHGELVTSTRPAAYPAYAYPYAYPGYVYPYGYPYGYYPYAFGYPYAPAYVGPSFGVGIGVRIGHGYDHGYHHR